MILFELIRYITNSLETYSSLILIRMISATIMPAPKKEGTIHDLPTGIPNFVIAQNGEPTQTADSVGMAEGDPVEEEDATLLTPSENIVPVNTSINFDASVSKLALVELVEEIENLIASEGGKITNAVKEEFDKADVIAKAKSEKAGAATSPAAFRERESAQKDCNSS